MKKVFPGNVLIELDSHYQIDRATGLKVMSKYFRQKHKGRVIECPGKLKKDDHIFFLSQEGQMLDGKVLMREKDVVLIFKKDKVEIYGNRVLIEPEKEKKELSEHIEKSGAHIKITPVGTVLEIGDEVKKIKVGKG